MNDWNPQTNTINLNQECNLGAIIKSFLWASQSSEHPAIVAKVLAYAGIIVKFLTSVALSNSARIGWKGKLSG